MQEMAPQTATEVAQFLASLSLRLQQRVDELAIADRHSVTARENFNVAFARAYQACQGTAEHRKQSAVLLTHDQRLAAEEADCRVRDLRRQIDAVKVRIDVGRSYGAAVRAEVGLAMSPFMGP